MRVFELATVGTRVDTGRARAGWFVSVGAPGDHLPPVGNYVGASSGFAATLASAPLGMSRYVYNNVEYIVWLEIGTNKTSGEWMLKNAVDAVRKAGLA